MSKVVMDKTRNFEIFISKFRAGFQLMGYFQDKVKKIIKKIIFNQILKVLVINFAF
uniref:Uncharacterized protein n=1 Tax=Aster yellows phytoplasma TaxID=35779 RepID=Q847T7_ASTYP|nr:hypothetical protein [Aster yellows phytoplasma]